jgi:hypothetical protein
VLARSAFFPLPLMLWTRPNRDRVISQSSRMSNITRFRVFGMQRARIVVSSRASGEAGQTIATPGVKLRESSQARKYVDHNNSRR